MFWGFNILEATFFKAPIEILKDAENFRLPMNDREFTKKAGLINYNINKCESQTINECLAISFLIWDQVTTFQFPTILKYMYMKMIFGEESIKTKLILINCTN